MATEGDRTQGRKSARRRHDPSGVACLSSVGRGLRELCYSRFLSFSLVVAGRSR